MGHLKMLSVLEAFVQVLYSFRPRSRGAYLSGPCRMLRYSLLSRFATSDTYSRLTKKEASIEQYRLSCVGDDILPAEAEAGV